VPGPEATGFTLQARRTSEVMTRTTIHFIRHGDAVPDAGATFDAATGYDILGLSTKGIAQARAMAERVAATVDLAAIYASPTLRARETAEALASAAGLEVAFDARVREVYLGSESVEHVAPEDRARMVKERLESLAVMALRDGSWTAVPDVEPGVEVRARVQSAVDDIVAKHPNQHVAIVSHAGSINAYFANILGVRRDFFFPIGNTSLNSVRIENGKPLMLRLNDTAHLERRLHR
jgi:probable phosphoglycerate mutase